MDATTAISQAGGAALISKACANRNMFFSTSRINNWKERNKFPDSEWTGETSVAPVICALIKAYRGETVLPADLCPGAGQYQHQENQSE